mmetsp:Transcript_98255/g.204929  ORF Transcript_98255/g.204929 Transcript_98255/m.204929 type:complete len:255 (+) Transcript_98255:72-836(+)|eukprot:CAMPEP_0206470554 /NCGR_PEP_ID=MMETSP0324_2-20121206/31007_1 /ASSEMBLY_ACC=CAM_ASM_000836 /TAXON_ID=2866 /ORGANISM="Crypthecodinium cohnii, Strain Seligo" /LENGTH=254 /DNA_ID=CAMNT_0053944651 /DNA_START=67 /DNA_END=831 /DNA_ORIENTATION=+
MAAVGQNYKQARQQDTDSEEYGHTGMSLGDANTIVRAGFVRKVYGILAVQLFVTTLCGAFIRFWSSQVFWRANMPLFYLCMFASLAFALPLICCRETAKKFPVNYLLLFGFTICEGVVVGIVTTTYTGDSVLMAVAATCVTFFALTAWACFTKTDFTGYGAYLSAGLYGLMGLSFVIAIMSWFGPVPSALNIMMALGGVLLFSMYTVYDTQLIMGGGNKANQFEIDDYVIAALSIYLDIINLFLYLLQLFGSRD